MTAGQAELSMLRDQFADVLAQLPEDFASRRVSDLVAQLPDGDAAELLDKVGVELPDDIAVELPDDLIARDAFQSVLAFLDFLAGRAEPSPDTSEEDRIAHERRQGPKSGTDA